MIPQGRDLPVLDLSYNAGLRHLKFSFAEGDRVIALQAMQHMLATVTSSIVDEVALDVGVPVLESISTLSLWHDLDNVMDHPQFSALKTVRFHNQTDGNGLYFVARLPGCHRRRILSFVIDSYLSILICVLSVSL